MGQILACIDASAYAESVCQLTAWAARQLTARVEVLHVIQRTDSAAAHQDLSGAIGLGVKSHLLEQLTRIDEAAGKLAVERGQILIDRAQDMLRRSGVAEIEVMHRHGGIVEAIVEREAAADIVIIGKRGASGAFAAEHIGSKVERVVRASRKPVFVASRVVKVPPKAVVIAYDGSPAASRAVDYVAASPLFAGLTPHVCSAGPGDAAHMSKVNEAAARLSAGMGLAPFISTANGPPHKVIETYMEGQPESILVMGAYGHSPLRAFIVGSTTTFLIRTVHVPVLLIR